MKVVLQKLCLVVLAISFFFLGCATYSKASQFDESSRRIVFKKENFSIISPPGDWKKIYRTKELIRWKQKVTRSSIAVDAGKISPHNFSRSNWGKWVMEWTRSNFEKQSELCEVHNNREGEIIFDKKEFYQVSALIKCSNFKGKDEGVYIDKNIYEKELTYAVLITEDKLYFFTLGAIPEFYNQGETVLHNLFKSFTFLDE